MQLTRKTALGLALKGATAQGDAWPMADGTWTILLPANEGGLQRTVTGLTKTQAAERLLDSEAL